MKNKKHLFNLPDGSTLKFAPHWQTGPQTNWFMSFDDARVWEASKKPKNKQYRVNLWSSQTDLYVVAADIDKLPEGFHSFDSLYEHLFAVFSREQAIVTRSASDKVKVFFLIETAPGENMSASIARETLAKIFNFDLSIYACIDCASSSYKITNLNAPLLRALSGGLIFLNPIQAVLPKEVGDKGSLNTSTTDSTANKPFRSYTGPLSDILPEAADLSGPKEKFLRILLEAKSLIRPIGFGVSTKRIGVEIGVSQQSISRYRKEFVIREWLTPHHDRSFKPGKQAKKFLAIGPLARAIKKLHQNTAYIEVPDSIPDGSWNEKLGSLVGQLYYYYSLEEILQKVKSIRGIEKKSRLSKIATWYKWYSTKRSLKKRVHK